MDSMGQGDDCQVVTSDEVIAWATAATAVIVLFTFVLQLIREIERRKARKVAAVSARLHFAPSEGVF